MEHEMANTKDHESARVTVRERQSEKAVVVA